MTRYLLTLILLHLFQVSLAQDSVKRAALIPDHMKLQFAGNIGFLSVSGGYINKEENLEGDLFYGYLPESIGGVRIHTLSAKMAAYPVRPVKAGGLRWKPVYAGLLVSYTFGEQYFSVNPENYPYTYYDHSTGLHGGLFAGTQIEKKFATGRSLGLYYELVTFDTEIISYLANRKSLKPGDILSIAIGMKYSFK